jgi:hypothetical protein
MKEYEGRLLSIDPRQTALLWHQTVRGSSLYGQLAPASRTRYGRAFEISFVYYTTFHGMEDL